MLYEALEICSSIAINKRKITLRTEEAEGRFIECGLTLRSCDIFVGKCNISITHCTYPASTTLAADSIIPAFWIVIFDNDSFCMKRSN